MLEIDGIKFEIQNLHILWKETRVMSIYRIMKTLHKMMMYTEILKQGTFDKNTGNIIIMFSKDNWKIGGKIILVKIKGKKY